MVSLKIIGLTLVAFVVNSSFLLVFDLFFYRN